MSDKFNDFEEKNADGVFEKPLEELLPKSMMTYAEYIILERALPRVEDGLKPVQRRILYTMYTLGMRPDTEFKKCARIVGDVLGKYHPHGDTSIYDAMVKLAQDFNMRNILVEGQGNFGSIDGDSPAAMRYTEARLASLSMEMLRDIDKKTIIDWRKNFDDTLDEPELLPARFPNLLVNGSVGISIGFATDIPTHNLTEVIDGCIAMIDKPSIKLDELMTIIKGPDFPSGGFMYGGDQLIEAYETGRGRVELRGKVDIENEPNGTQNIVISEIPYNAKKTGIIEKIYQNKDKKMPLYVDVIDVVDESDRNGMRIVVKLKKGVDSIKLLNKLYKDTNLQTRVNINMVAIAGGKPRQMGLIQILKYYLEYQRKVVYRRSLHDINNAKARAHILEGYNIIIADIDEVISIIRNSSSRTESKARLKERFELSEAQAEAVLSLQLGNINKLDVNKYTQELAELLDTIDKLSKIIASVREQDKVIKKELIEIRDKYKIKRLTTIVDSFKDIDVRPTDIEQLGTGKRCFVGIDAEGRVKVLSSRNYLWANREAEFAEYKSLLTSLVQVEPNHLTLIFGNKGNCYKLDTNTAPERPWEEPAMTLENLFENIEQKDEKAVFLLSFDADKVDDYQEVFYYTKRGLIKRTLLKQYIVNRDIFQYGRINEGDEVINGEIVDPTATVFFISTDGQCVNMLTNDVSQQGRIAGGVQGMSLNPEEEVIYAEQATVENYSLLEDECSALGEIVIINDKGIGKRVVASTFAPMRRARKGIRIMDVYNQKTKVMFAKKVLEPFDVVFVLDDYKTKVVNTEDIRIENKDSKGKPIIAKPGKIITIIKHVSDVDDGILS